MMNRLTNCIEGVVYYSNGKYPPATLCAEMETSDIRRCMRKLAAYEDTKLEPSEVEEMRIQNEVLSDTVNMLSPLIMENYNLKTQKPLSESNNADLNIFELAGYGEDEAGELMEFCRAKGMDERYIVNALQPYTIALKLEDALKKLSGVE